MNKDTDQNLFDNTRRVVPMGTQKDSMRLPGDGQVAPAIGAEQLHPRSAKRFGDLIAPAGEAHAGDRNRGSFNNMVGVAKPKPRNKRS